MVDSALPRIGTCRVQSPAAISPAAAAMSSNGRVIRLLKTTPAATVNRKISAPARKKRFRSSSRNRCVGAQSCSRSIRSKASSVPPPGALRASCAASSSSAAARESSVAVNGHPRPSRRCCAPTRSGWVCRSAAGAAAGSTRRACSRVATARGALPGSAATMRASASAVVTGSASSVASARTCSVQGAPTRAAAMISTDGSMPSGTRTSNSSVIDPASVGSPTTCTERMLHPAAPTAAASSPSRPGLSSSST